MFDSIWKQGRSSSDGDVTMITENYVIFVARLDEALNFDIAHYNRRRFFVDTQKLSEIIKATFLHKLC